MKTAFARAFDDLDLSELRSWVLRTLEIFTVLEQTATRSIEDEDKHPDKAVVAVNKFKLVLSQWTEIALGSADEVAQSKGEISRPWSVCLADLRSTLPPCPAPNGPLIRPLFQNFLHALHVGRGRPDGQYKRFLENVPYNDHILAECCFVCICATATSTEPTGAKTAQVTGCSNENWFRKELKDKKRSKKQGIQDLTKILKDVRYHWLAQSLLAQTNPAEPSPQTRMDAVREGATRLWSFRGARRRARRSKNTYNAWPKESGPSAQSLQTSRS